MNAKTLLTKVAVRGLLVVGIMLAAAVLPANVNRDKTGTNAERSKRQGSQVACGVQLANLGSLQAERSGFEPEMPVSRHTGLAIRRFRPLSHLSDTLFCRRFRVFGRPSLILFDNRWDNR